MLSKIHLDDEKYSGYTIANSPINTLSNLNKINIFIGANNSGKSRLLRLIFSDREFKFELKDVNLSKLTETLLLILNEVSHVLFQNDLEDVSGQNIVSLKQTIRNWVKKLDKFEFSKVSTLVQEFNDFWEVLLNFKSRGGAQLRNSRNFSINANWNEINFEIKRIAKRFNDIIRQTVPTELDYSVDRIYIPILRGLRPIQIPNGGNVDQVEDNYRSRTIKDYFEKVQIPSDEIFTGLGLYQDVRRMLLGKREDREKVKQFEDFLSKTFFNNESVSLTPHIEDDSIHLSIGEEEWPIYRIGDGIQSLIVLLYPLFFNQGKKLLIFIEEPENSIHPGLQRLFIETLLLDKFDTFQYFITTHSNHFLDLTLEYQQISVYSFQKDKPTESKINSFQIENVSSENSQILDLIGARTSSVFLSNCTIWVEGITDRLYLKKYLEVYQKKFISEKQLKSVFREDYNYSFIEYSGGNIMHWSFADECGWDKIKSNRISRKIFLICDKDSTDINPESAKSKRIKLLKEQLGENFIVTEGKEIENTLSPDILINAIKYLEKENFINVTYDRNDIKESNYKNIGIGKFINLNFKGVGRKYEAENGSLYCKLDFCKAAVELITVPEDLSSEATNIAEKIYTFISECNL